MAVHSSYSIGPLDPSDAASLAQTMMRAFHGDTHWRSMWHGKPLAEIIADCKERLPWNLVNVGPLKRLQKVVDGSSGEVVGFARWILPHDLAESWPEARGPEVDDEMKAAFHKRWEGVTDDGMIRGLDHAMAAELSTMIDLSEERIKAEHGGRFLYLDYLAVRPAHQRRGIGNMLLRSGLAFADENRLKTMVNARASGVKLYEKNSFVIVDEVVQDGKKYEWTTPQITAVLVRESRHNLGRC